MHVVVSSPVQSKVRQSVVSCEIIVIFRHEKAFYFLLSLTHASASWDWVPFVWLGGLWNGDGFFIEK